MLADSLAKALGGQGVVFERATCARAAASARALAPALIVLAGDAAQGRGAGMIKQLDHVPLLVVSAPDFGGVMPPAPPRRIGFLSPAGGVNECARRLHALIQLFNEEGLATCSMQQLADTVAPRAQPAPGANRLPSPSKTFGTQPLPARPASQVTQPTKPVVKPVVSRVPQATKPMSGGAPAPAPKPESRAVHPPPRAATPAPETIPPAAAEVIYVSNSDVPTNPPVERASQPAIDVSLSEPPPSANVPAAEPPAAPPMPPRAAAAEAVQPPAARPAEAVQPRPARHVRNPLDAAAPWQPPAAPASSIVEAGADWEIAASPKRHRATVVYVLAAIGCAALLFRWISAGSLDPAGGTAAMGALKPAPKAPETLEPVEPPRVVSPEPPREAPSEPPPAGVQTPVAHSVPSATPRVAQATDEAASAAPASGAQALVEEGATLLQQGRLGLAESSYQKALAATPEYPNAIIGLVHVHLARRDGTEAVRWANRLVSKQPTNATYQLLLGDAEALSGDQDAARAAWANAAKRGNTLARQRLE